MLVGATVQAVNHNNPSNANDNPVATLVALQMAKKAGSRTNDPVLPTVQAWVKNHLFKRRKFIANESDLDYSLEQSSICWQLLDHLNVVGETGVNCWNRYRSWIRKEMNKRRNACQDQCKKVYLSKYSFVMFYVWIICYVFVDGVLFYCC